MIDLAAFRESASSFARSERGRSLIRWSRYVMGAVVLILLAFQLTGVGWAEILRSLPTTPLFYLFFACIYLALPLSEVLIYRTFWRFPFREGFGVFLMKRVYNKDVLGYSGEVYLMLWAKRRLGLADAEILGVVKDNTIVSSVTSTAFAVVVLALLFFTGQHALGSAGLGDQSVTAVGALMVGLILVALGIRFRRSLFRLPARLLGLIGAVHLVRLALVMLLQVLQWWSVMPHISMRVWFTYLALLIVTSRIPLLPARDLLFIGAGVELSRMLDISSAGVAGMLLVASVLDKSLNFVLFSALSLVRGSRPSPGDDLGPGAPEMATDSCATGSTGTAFDTPHSSLSPDTVSGGGVRE
jgi:hypothetical protein